MVKIDTSVANARVSIPGRELSSANKFFPVQMNAFEERVQIIVEANGYRRVGFFKVIRAGGEYSFDVDLEQQSPGGGR